MMVFWPRQIELLLSSRLVCPMSHISGIICSTIVLHLQVIYGQFNKVTLDNSLGTLSQYLEKDHFALVVHDQKVCKYLCGIVDLIRGNGALFYIEAQPERGLVMKKHCDE